MQRPVVAQQEDTTHIHPTPASEYATTRRLSILEKDPPYIAPVVPKQRRDYPSMVANIGSALLLRFAGRISFTLLGFYLGEHFASATVVALVLEAFYISELALSPFIGSLSDRVGRKPFLVLAPVLGSVAAIFLLASARLFPHPDNRIFNAHLALLLLLILLGRLFEGATTAMNTPACLGYITDSTVNAEKLRARVLTAFEIVTVGGMALAIPFGGKISSWLGVWGFGIVIVLHLVNTLLVLLLVRESEQHMSRNGPRSSLFESLKMLRYQRVFTFLPAWLSVNTLVGAWMTLILIMLTYPNPAADHRHPGQLLYGGFSKELAASLIGGFALFFLLGMGLWTWLFLARRRRTTVMLIGLSGLAICIMVLTIINGTAENLRSLTLHTNIIIALLFPVLLVGLFLLSGFTPAALTQMAAIAETMPGKRGAVMGLYSVVLSIGQLIGASLGGFSVDMKGFYGLMIFSTVLGCVSLISVLYMRAQGHDKLRLAQ